jgi:hypothetical protein
MSWKSLLFFLGAFLLCVTTRAQQRPKIQETFEAHGFLHVYVDGKTFVSGRGQWAIDQPHGKGIHHFEFSHHHNLNRFELNRYDLAEDFVIQEGECHPFAVKPPMPTQWQWLSQAIYTGNQTIDGKLCDLWTENQVELTEAEAEANLRRTVAVLRSSPNIPVFLKMQNSTHTVTLLFGEFHTRQPDPHWFDIPSICNHTKEPPGHQMVSEVPKDVQVASKAEVTRLLEWLKVNVTKNPMDACAAAAWCAGVICGQCHCPYVYGGEENCCQTKSSGFDCSGLCQWSYVNCGKFSIPRTTFEMWDQIHGSCNGCSPENTGPCVSGDLLFYYPSNKGPDHVMMYTGGGYAAECPHTGEDCRIIRPYSSPFVGCRRVC